MSQGKKLKLVALTIEELALVLQKSGSRTVSVENIQKDIAAGCPVNADGTINHPKYMAWLLKEMKK